MPDILDQAVDTLRRLSAGDRDSMARAILSVAQGQTALDIEAEHLPAVLEGLAQIERGDVIEGEPEALVAAAFQRQRS